MDTGVVASVVHMLSGQVGLRIETREERISVVCFRFFEPALRGCNAFWWLSGAVAKWHVWTLLWLCPLKPSTIFNLLDNGRSKEPDRKEIVRVGQSDRMSSEGPLSLGQVINISVRLRYIRLSLLLLAI
jgi:hypothetical protein